MKNDIIKNIYNELNHNADQFLSTMYKLSHSSI